MNKTVEDSGEDQFANGQSVGTIGRAHAALSSAVFRLNFDAAARIEFVPDARELADSGSVAQAVESFAL